MLKRLARSPLAMRVASALIGAYIRLVHATSRWTLLGREHVDAAAAEGKCVIVAFWHGRLLMGAAIRRETDKPVYMLISAHRDGEIIARGVAGFGIKFIRGSAPNPDKPGKNKSGASAIAQMLAALSEGSFVGFTPDGPRGPGERAKPGVVRLAQMSGAPIVPASFSVSRGRRLNTWDRFLLAAPFSKGYYLAGKPMHAPQPGDSDAMEKFRLELENALQQVSNEADALAGRTNQPRD